MSDLMRKVLILVLMLSVCSWPSWAGAEEEYLAPDFNLEDIKGNRVSLGSYREKEAVILIFWTTWCPYCRKELKNLNGMYSQLKDEGFEVLAVNFQESAQKAGSFAGDYQLGYRVLLDRDGSVTGSYGVVGIPSYIIIDKKGIVRFAGSYFPHRQYKELVSR